MNKEQKRRLKPLFHAIVSLENVDECERFLEDLCTIKELTDMSDRLEVAQLLLNKETYETIQHKTKMSSTTISRVNRCIQYGRGGYQEIIKRLKK